jgi:uncharacterized Ntn-hydrolase superfamily protein
MTYSLIGRDGETGELGVAVQSRAFRTGAICPWARAGVGAIATQSFTDVRYGVRGLEPLADGVSPADALARLVAEDDRADFRQVAFLGADGATSAYTGGACIPAAGHLAVENASAQGNMLASADVWPAMLDAFTASTGQLAHRLLDALDAGEVAGGDFRGRHAGAVLVVSAERSDAEPWRAGSSTYASTTATSRSASCAAWSASPTRTGDSAIRRPAPLPRRRWTPRGRPACARTR